ncbi:hypothetical protein E4V60_09510, partial [Proteus mirabilis]
MLRSQRRGRDPPCWLSEKEPLVGKRRVNFQRCWLPVSRIGLHRRGVDTGRRLLVSNQMRLAL